MIRLFAAHLLGNALILLLGYYWLGLADSSGVAVLWSAFVIVAVFAAALWLHGSALVFFRQKQTAFRTTARHLLPLLLLAVIAVALYAGLSFLRDSFSHQAFVIGSYATMKTRKPVTPSSVLKAWHLFIAFLEWLVLPALLVPVAAAIAERGWRGFSFHALHRCRSFLYWVGVAAIMFAGIYMPWRLANWVPTFAAFSVQFLSFLVRFAVTYLLFTTGLLLLEYFTSGGKPSSTQATTGVSP